MDDGEGGADEGSPYDFDIGDDEVPRPDATLVHRVRHGWDAWFRQNGAAAEPRALLGQMLYLARHTDDPAGAIGVSAATWNRWLMNVRGVTDKAGRLLGVRPSTASQRRIRNAVRADRTAAIPTPTAVVITSILVWAKYINGRGTVSGKVDPTEYETGRRTTTLDHLDLEACRAAWGEFRDVASAQAMLDAFFDRYEAAIAPLDCDGLVFKA